MTIVQDDVLGGEPRLAGRRVAVRHVVAAVRDFGGKEAAAEQLRIPEDEVREAIEWREDNPDEMDKWRV
ncbi:DUF433 domain-containing protein [Halomicroarcula sp. F28]|uniref:DUF433 domain-containing protein n=1 Tax=Haloarcula salinisoli TaxID=2487746 RepID=UPI001C734E6E|nr:DUF433 domain-containing protein [Halomicroarcula salinisoli]MBX0284743.1 DUF433 domain-containing protein [Halomicroarcula salinisoli]